MISLDYQIRNALIELQEWADVSTPEDIEKFYREGFPYYHSAFSTLDADNFLFITNENPWRAIPVFCYNKDECRLARYMNNIYRAGGLIMVLPYVIIWAQLIMSKTAMPLRYLAQVL